MRTSTTIYTILLFFTLKAGLFSAAVGQSKPEFALKHYVDTATGKIYWNRNLPFTVQLISTSTPDSVFLQNTQVDAVYFDTEGINTVGTPWLIDPETKRYVQPKEGALFHVYADGLEPSTISKYSAATKYTYNNLTYFGKGLLITLLADDGLSGIQNTFYAIDADNYQQYTSPISYDTEGEHSIAYFSVDNVGNTEKTGSRSFFIDTTPPETYHSITDVNIENNVLSLSSKLLLEASDNMVGIKQTYYSLDGNTPIPYNGGSIVLSNLENGDHVFEYYSEDKVKNKEKPKTLNFYLDRIAPILSSDILGDRYLVNDRIYFSGRTKMKLTAIDNKSGVKNILFSINDEDYQTYTDPFYLPSKEGIHTVRYFAEDNTGNNTGGTAANGKKLKYDEYEHAVVKKIFTDLVGPSISHKYIGPNFPSRDTVFISPQTQLQLSAKDGESGLQFMAYSVDGAKEETKYESPIKITDGGVHEIELIAYDNVNNRNRISIYCYVDDVPPQILTTFSIPSRGKHTEASGSFESYPAYVTVFLAASDNTVGAESIDYSLNGAPKLRYIAPISGFKKNSINTIAVTAFDKLKNKMDMTITFYISE